MFRKSEDNPQLDVFSSASEHLTGSRLKFYEKNNSWHNLFYKHVVMQVNESDFKVLFDETNGAPNASIRILVGMMILKEGQGWSDEQLFNSCNYDLLIRRALGLLSLSEAAPVASTYYLFRKRLVDYMQEKGIDLMKECQSKITENQILNFEVSGKSIRMDSKLIGSNITWYSRYELIHETLRQFIIQHKGLVDKKNLRKDEKELIKNIAGETGNRVVYRSTKEELSERFLQLGKLMFRFVRLFKNYKMSEYLILKSVFYQQFSVNRSKVVTALENDEISARSIQSPHDPDCTYRNKDGNKVKGYSTNVTETCDKSKQGEPTLNLITDTQVDVVTTADNRFLKEAVENTEKIVNSPVEKIHADGAYHSIENQDFCDQENKELVLTAMQGAESRYDLNLDKDNSDNLTVFDRETRKYIETKAIKSRKEPNKKRWKIINDKGKPRYFDLENVRTSQLRQKLRKLPPDETNIRNNVEATIFQLGYHYSNDKSRYRGLDKHKLWAYSRSLWINLVRIEKYVTQISQRPHILSKLTKSLIKICIKLQKYAYLISCKLNLPRHPKILISVAN